MVPNDESAVSGARRPLVTAMFQRLVVKSPLQLFAPQSMIFFGVEVSSIVKPLHLYVPVPSEASEYPGVCAVPNPDVSRAPAEVNRTSVMALNDDST